MAADGDRDAARLRDGLARWGLDPAVVPALIAYRDLLARWNRVYNLSAVRDPQAMIPRHLLDSLAVVPWLPEGALLDIGTGAGLPGLPIAIAQPQRPVTLLEPNNKKVRFLRQACLALKLDNVTLVAERIEDFDPAQPYAAAICRAFTDAAGFWAVAAPRVADNAPVIAMKGRPEAESLAGLEAAGVSCRRQPLEIPGLDASRHLLIMERSIAATGMIR
ncbi:16S rRNA (guanine(527)-N(7))-methyltransferase RsmG [Gammaproteobacteria bacterium 2W06]|nr:16S rRNA (guanine(527)-N(7))-methyltransferase RsmG [Gammaproteobacteria bacterium 2W06]